MKNFKNNSNDCCFECNTDDKCAKVCGPCDCSSQCGCCNNCGCKPCKCCEKCKCCPCECCKPCPPPKPCPPCPPTPCPDCPDCPDACGNIVTGNAESIICTSAVIANSIFYDFQGQVVNVGVECCMSPNFNGGVSTYATENTSPFTVYLSGLLSGMTYYYRAFVETSSHRCYGSIKSFATSNPNPMVVTGDAINITPTTASIANNTYNNIPGTIFAVQVEFSVDSSMSTSQGAGTEPVGTPYSVNLTALTPNTFYYYRARVMTSTGIYYGEIKQFKTPSVIA